MNDGLGAPGRLDRAGGQYIPGASHGARFDIRTGQALSLPAVVDIPTYPVRVEGTEILIGLPIEE